MLKWFLNIKLHLYQIHKDRTRLQWYLWKYVHVDIHKISKKKLFSSEYENKCHKMSRTNLLPARSMYVCFMFLIWIRMGMLCRNFSYLIRNIMFTCTLLLIPSALIKQLISTFSHYFFIGLSSADMDRASFYETSWAFHSMQYIRVHLMDAFCFKVVSKLSVFLRHSLNNQL